MKKFIDYIYALCLPVLYCIGMCACQDNLDLNRNESSDGNLKVKGSLVIQDLPTVVSRGEFGDTPQSDELKLTILEFSLGINDANSFLTNVYQVDLTGTDVDNGGVVDFEFEVKTSDSPKKVLHFMVSDDFVWPDFGSVATILPTLTSASMGSMDGVESAEAYWGCVEFPDGLFETGDDGKPTLCAGVTQKLTRVPMVRNFAKISVTVGTPEKPVTNFQLLGYELINVPNNGTIAPWDRDKVEVPQLLNGSSMKTYSNIDYAGFMPSEALLVNTELNAQNWDESNFENINPRYIYEHPYEESRRTYLIIYGIYTTGSVEHAGFYKVDIGAWKDGTFKPYNLLRNFHYQITITSVSAPGWESVSDAIKGAPFNNLSASTETKDMLSVSDGINLLTVNDTNHIIVDDNQQIEVLYQYIENIGTDNEGWSDLARPVNLVAGPDKVIKSFTEPEVITDQYGAKWEKFIIYCNNPTINVKTQEFQIINGTGLSRTINLILRRPWQYAYLLDRNGNLSDITITVAKGQSPTYPFSPTLDAPLPQEIGNESGAELTVYFALPDKLPSTMFPLDFRLEAKYQGIENSKIDNMVVYTGQSLFDADILSLSYIKTVTYDEYSYLYANDTSTDIDVNKPNVNHVIACRFKTINTVAAGSEAEIMVHSEYFRPNISVKFTRGSGSGGLQ